MAEAARADLDPHRRPRRAGWRRAHGVDRGRGRPRRLSRAGHLHPRRGPAHRRDHLLRRGLPRARRAGGREPDFSLYPMAGDVDVIIASELLEAGRTLEMDYASPERTTLIASTHRLFAIGEKSALGNGIFPRERLEEAARKLARRLIAFDALAGRAADRERGQRRPARRARRDAHPADVAGRLRGGDPRGRCRRRAQSRRLQGGARGGDAVAGRRPPERRRARGPRCGRSARRALGARSGDFLALADRIAAEFPDAAPPDARARRSRASSTTRTAATPSVPRARAARPRARSRGRGSPRSSRGGSPCG